MATDKDYVRTTITVPKVIKKRMKALRKKGITVNWSLVAAEAFLLTVKNLEKK